MRRYSLHLALAALIVVALPATSTNLTWYNNRGAWEAAVGNSFSLIDFTGVATGLYGTAAGVTVGDVQFAGMNEGLLVTPFTPPAWNLYVSNNDSPGPGILQPYLYNTGNSTSEPMRAFTSAKFPTDITYKAVGVDVAVLVGTSFYVKDNVDNLWVSNNTTGFVGFVSDVGVNQVWFASKTGALGGQGSYILDNFTYSNGTVPDQDPPETPDLGTLILCGTGLSLLSFVMRLRKRVKT